MKKRKLKARIKALEARVAELEARPTQYMYYPQPQKRPRLFANGGTLDEGRTGL